jgi:membrane protein implicated in regulation of membrane protease activity
MLFVFLVLVALGSVAAAFLTFYYLVSTLGLGPEAPGWSVAAILVLLVIDVLLIAVFWPRTKRGMEDGDHRPSKLNSGTLSSAQTWGPCKIYRHISLHMESDV